MLRRILRVAGIPLVCLPFVAAIAVCPAQAQGDNQDVGLYFTSEFSTVSTLGNSESLTLGLNATLGHTWEHSELKLEAGGIRTESTIKTRTATGSTQRFVVHDKKRTEKTAEAFHLRGRYDRNVNTRFFVFGGVDWLRNTFAGIDSRMLFAAGAGNTWIDTDVTRLKTNVGFTYTFQDDVFSNPLLKMNFPGTRIEYRLRSKVSETTDFESALVGDWNLDNMNDVRLNLINAVSITINSTLALKPALRLLWQNDPSSTEVSLIDNAGVATGETVLVPLEKLDSFFTLSLVLRL